MQHNSEHPLAEGLLERCLVSGEFVLKSGRLSLEKFDIDNLTQSNEYSDKFLLWRTKRALGALVHKNMPECEMILTVADGANPLCRGVARAVSRLQKGRPEVLARETRKLGDDDFWIQGGNIHVRDRNIVVVDDVFTAGTNIGRVADTVERFGGIVVGAAVILNRNEYGASTITRQDSEQPFIRVHSMVQHPIPTFKAEY